MPSCVCRGGSYRRWPSISHAFVGRAEDVGELESFKARAGLKSVPFYVALTGDGRIDQVKIIEADIFLCRAIFQVRRVRMVGFIIVKNLLFIHLLIWLLLNFIPYTKI